MTADALLCDICRNESGGTFVGVASVPGAPVSIAWCSECLKRNTAPAFVFDHDFLYVADGNVENLVEWARTRETWADGRYISFDEYVKRFTPEDVAKAHAEFEEACRRSDEAEAIRILLGPE
jgi:hypothetical protein